MMQDDDVSKADIFSVSIFLRSETTFSDSLAEFTIAWKMDGISLYAGPAIDFFFFRFTFDRPNTISY